jgi:hypothetical protein
MSRAGTTDQVQADAATEFLDELLNRAWLLTEAELYAPQEPTEYQNYLTAVFTLFRSDLERTVERAIAAGALSPNSPVAIDYTIPEKGGTP